MSRRFTIERVCRLANPSVDLMRGATLPAPLLTRPIANRLLNPFDLIKGHDRKCIIVICSATKEKAGMAGRLKYPVSSSYRLLHICAVQTQHKGLNFGTWMCRR